MISPFRPAAIFVMAALLAGGPVRAEITGLAEELFEYQPPDPDWGAILEARVKAGLPLPVLPPARRGPATSASPAELLAYWREDGAWRNKQEPSAEVRAKILQAVQDEPAAIPQALRALPPSEEAAKILLPLLGKIPAESAEGLAHLREVRAWIYRHSGLLREEVVADVPQADWDRYTWGENSDPTLDALVARDPQLAAKVLEEQAAGKNPGLAVVAARLLAEELQPERAEHWRSQLKAAAANAGLEKKVRQIAVETLLHKDWPGREPWVLETLQKEDVGELHWFAGEMFDTSEHWIPLFLPMLGGANRHAHNNAANLIARLADRPQDYRPLLPWLADAAWAEDDGVRLRMVQELEEMDAPECVPPLVELIQKDQDETIIAYACQTLSHYKAKEAVPEMKAALARCEGNYDRQTMIEAIQGLGGFSREEIAAAIEACFIALPDEEARERFPHDWSTKHAPEVGVGAHFAKSPSEDPALLQVLAKRADAIAKEQAKAAVALRNWIASSPTAEGRAMLANQLDKSKVSATALTRGLENRRNNAKSWDGSAFKKLLDRKGQTGGFAAVLSGDPKAMAAALNSKDKDKRVALLAAARISGDILDLDRVAKWHKGEDDDLADAADSYLRDLTDPKAEELLDKDRKDRPLLDRFGQLEEMLRASGKLPAKAPQEIFALHSYSQGGSSDSWYLIAWADSALAVQSMGGGRFGTAVLPQEKLAALRNYVTTYRADELPPLNWGWADGVQYGYSHVTPAGSHRVFMDNPPSGWRGHDGQPAVQQGGSVSDTIVLYAGLMRAMLDPFEDLKLDVRHASGLEIIIPRETAQVRTVWKQGDDLRVLVNEDWNSPHWRRVSLADKKLLETVDEPAASPILAAKRDLHPDFQIESDYHFRYPWQVRSGDATIHAGRFKDVQGLWRCRVGKEPELIAKGWFSGELVSADGRWCVAAKVIGQSWAEPNTVVRIDLGTKQEFPLKLEPADNFDPLAFVGSRSKFLVVRNRDWQNAKAGPESPESYLLDPASGDLEKIEAESGPRVEGGPRPLQAVSGSPTLSWMADGGVYSGTGAQATLGKYDSNSFRFEVVGEFKGIHFDSSTMWVDEAEGMIYAAMDGDLVRIPLKEER